MNPEELVQVTPELCVLGDIQKTLPLVAENIEAEARIDNQGFQEKRLMRNLLTKVLPCFRSTDKNGGFNKSSKLQVGPEKRAEPVLDYIVYETRENKHQWSSQNAKRSSINDQQKWRDLVLEYNHRKEEMPYLRKTGRAEPLQNNVSNTMESILPERFPSLQETVLQKKSTDMAIGYDYRKEISHLQKTGRAGPLQNNVITTIDTIPQESFPGVQNTVLQKIWSDVVREYDHRMEEMPHLRKTERAMPSQNNIVTNTIGTVPHESFPSLQDTVSQKKWSDPARGYDHRNEEMPHPRTTEPAVLLQNNVITNTIETIPQECFPRLEGTVPQKKRSDLVPVYAHRRKEISHLRKTECAMPVQNVVTNTMQTLPPESFPGAECGRGSKDQQKLKNQGGTYDSRQEEMPQLQKTVFAEVLKDIVVNRMRKKTQENVPKVKHRRNQSRELSQKGRKVF